MYDVCASIKVVCLLKECIKKEKVQRVSNKEGRLLKLREIADKFVCLSFYRRIEQLLI